MGETMRVLRFAMDVNTFFIFFRTHLILEIMVNYTLEFFQMAREQQPKGRNKRG